MARTNTLNQSHNHSKRRVFCNAANKHKYLYKTKNAADKSILYNSQEIAPKNNGHCPIRSYYCHFCGGYHTTSHPNKDGSQCNDSLDIFITLYEERKLRNIFKEEGTEQLNATYFSSNFLYDDDQIVDIEQYVSDNQSNLEFLVNLHWVLQWKCGIYKELRKKKELKGKDNTSEPLHLNFYDIDTIKNRYLTLHEAKGRFGTAVGSVLSEEDYREFLQQTTGTCYPNCA